MIDPPREPCHPSVATAAAAPVQAAAGEPVVSIVIVAWNSWSELDVCLRSIEEHAADLPRQVIVVDNGSSDGTPGRLAERYPAVECIALASNSGFPHACNVGFTRARGRYLLALNPDTEIHAGTLQRSLEFLRGHPGYGCVGVKTLKPNGRVQLSCARQFVTLRGAVFGALLLDKVFTRLELLRSPDMAFWDHGDERDVDMLQGAYMMFPAEVYRRVGGFDETQPLFYEDHEFCLRLHRHLLKIRYLADVSITHQVGASTRAAPSRQIAFLRYDACQRAIASYQGRLHARLYPWLLLGALPLKLALLPLLGLGMWLRNGRADLGTHAWETLHGFAWVAPRLFGRAEPAADLREARGGKAKVLFVGQVPPPFGGQAIMQQLILEGRYDGLELHHVRMAFSKEMGEVGRIRLGKLLHLPAVILRSAWVRLRHGARILYYPPAGPDLVPVCRDVAILLSIRWLFDKTVFHFHASGVSELYARLPRLLRGLFRAAYFKPDLAIQLSELDPADGPALEAGRTVTLPYGIPDEFEAARGRPLEPSPGPRPVILFAGVLRESKGVLVLLDACQKLRAWGVPFRARLMGDFHSGAFRLTLERRLGEAGIANAFELLGVRTGEAKWTAYRDADVFCLPSFFESESFGLVVLEAMQFELPVVATRWRGIPSLVADGRSGYLVPVRDSAALAEKLRLLLEDQALRRAMGRRGREAYLESYTLEAFRRGFDQAILAVARPAAS